MRSRYTTSVEMKNPRYKEQQSLIQNHMGHERRECAREQKIAL